MNAMATEPTIEKMIAMASGTNSLPSIPLRAKSGMKAAITMRIAKKTGLPIWVAPLNTTSSRVSSDFQVSLTLR